MGKMTEGRGCSCPGGSVAKYHELGELTNINLLSHDSRVWKSEIKVWVGLVLSESHDGASGSSVVGAGRETHCLSWCWA